MAPVPLEKFLRVAALEEQTAEACHSFHLHSPFLEGEPQTARAARLSAQPTPSLLPGRFQRNQPGEDPERVPPVQAHLGEPVTTREKIETANRPDVRIDAHLALELPLHDSDP